MISIISMYLYAELVFVWFDSLRPSQQFFSYVGKVFLGWTSTKRGLMCLAQFFKLNASEAQTRNTSVLSQALYHWATGLDPFAELEKVWIYTVFQVYAGVVLQGLNLLSELVYILIIISIRLLHLA